MILYEVDHVVDVILKMRNLSEDDADKIMRAVLLKLGKPRIEREYSIPLNKNAPEPEWMRQ